MKLSEWKCRLSLTSCLLPLQHLTEFELPQTESAPEPRRLLTEVCKWMVKE